MLAPIFYYSSQQIYPIASHERQAAVAGVTDGQVPKVLVS